MARTIDKAEDFPTEIKRNPSIMVVLRSSEATSKVLGEQLDILGTVMDRKGKKLKEMHLSFLGGLRDSFYYYICPEKHLIPDRYEDLISAIRHFIDIKKREEADSANVQSFDVAKEMISDISLARSFFDACFLGEKKRSGAKKWVQVLQESHKGSSMPSGNNINRIFEGIGKLLGYKKTTLYNNVSGQGKYFKLVAKKIRKHFNCAIDGDCKGVKKSKDIAKITDEMESDIGLVRAYLDAYFRMTDNLEIWHGILSTTTYHNSDVEEVDDAMEELKKISLSLGYKKGDADEIYNALCDKKKARIEVARRIRIQLTKAVKARKADRKKGC